MALSHKTVSIGTSATELHTAPGPQNVYVRTPAGLTENTYVGGSGATTSDYGLRAAPDENTPLIPMRPGDQLFGLHDGTGSIDVHVLIVDVKYV